MRLQPPKEGEAAPTQKSEANQEQVNSVLDLEEYPNATIVQNMRLTSADYAPDEARFELIRTSEDAPDKVTKYYEEKLRAKASGTAEKRQVFGATPRGNSVKALIEADGAGSKITLVVISFMK